MASTQIRGKTVDDEDASALKLGPDYQDGKAGCLVIAEVKYLLEQRSRGHSDNAVYKKTFDYVTMFSRFVDPEACQTARGHLRKNPELHPFEVVQIANLCPREAEEAKALIPSLAPREDDELQEMLNNIAALRRVMG